VPVDRAPPLPLSPFTSPRPLAHPTLGPLARSSYPRALLDHVVAFLDRTPPTATPTAPPTLVDLGCGPGLSTFDWLNLPSSASSSPRFSRIIGVDPSQGMVTAARDILADRGGPPPSADIRFEVARGDHLAHVVADESVDLAIAGQAAHWFDAPATYAELARVLKPGGAFAFWVRPRPLSRSLFLPLDRHADPLSHTQGYGEFFFPGKPELSALIPRYSAGTLGPSLPPSLPCSLSLRALAHLAPALPLAGPYWEQPGRSIVEDLLVPFPLPAASSSSSPIPSSTASQFDPASLTRTFFLRPQAAADADAEPHALPPLLEPIAASLGPPSPSSSSSTTWLAPSPSPSPTSSPSPTTGLARLEVHRTLLLTRQWSPAQLEGYLRTWSAAHAFDEAHPGRDVVSGFLRELREAEGGLRELGEGETVEVAWEVGIVMGRKKA